MPTEYNPAADDAAIASPAPAPVSTDEPLGEAGYKALKAQRAETNSEREQRKALEKQTKQLEQMLAESKKALEQTTLTLEQKYAQENEQYKTALLTEAQQAIQAEREARQAEAEARQIAEQRAALLEQQRMIASIQNGFTDIFKDVLVNPRKVSAYMAQIADDLTVDNSGQPALIVRDRNGEPTGLAPLEQAVSYFQQIYPKDFKPPAEQKVGGGYRNLAASNGIPSQRSNQSPLKLSIRDINTNPQAYLANRDRIAAGDFETK